MTFVLPPYPAYKETGIPWLGRIPAHWDVLPNRALFVEIRDQNHPNEPLLSVTIKQGVIEQKTLLTSSSNKDSSRLDKSSYKLVRPGDIVYNKMRAWQNAIGESRFRGIVSPAYIVQRLRANDISRYYHYLFRTPLFAKEAERWSYGITSDMWSLRPEHFKQIYSPRPPLDEQRAIARYLDWADGRIRRLIRARQRQIKLLEEYKQALIQQAVTGKGEVRKVKGADGRERWTLVPCPAEQMKDAGVPWLGQVPRHWDVVRLKRVCEFAYGDSLPSDIRAHGTVQVFGSNGLVGYHNESNTLAPCIIIGRKGSFGKVNFSWHPVFAIDTTYYIDRRFAKADLRWLFYLLLWMRLDDVSKDSAVPGLAREDAYQRLLPLPTNLEQHDIAHFLDEQSARIDAAIAALRRSIDLLREYRTRLIAAAVTGQVDVRALAARLPEEPVDDLPEDDIEQELSEETLEEDLPAEDDEEV